MVKMHARTIRNISRLILLRLRLLSRSKLIFHFLPGFLEVEFPVGSAPSFPTVEIGVGHFVQPEFLETTNARRYVE
jgi:hypothetical protein